MNDSEIRSLVLKELYKIRHTNPHAAIPADTPGLLSIDPPVLLGVLRQLRDKGLIEFTPLSGGANMFGRGKISAYGVDAIEEDTTSAANRELKGSSMTLKQFLAKHEDHAGKMVLMIIRARSDHTNWQEPYRQAVYELTDLFADHTIDNNYVITLRTEFGSLIRPDADKLETLSALIKSAITRLERRPELFKGDDQGSPNTFFRPTVHSEPSVQIVSSRLDPREVQGDLIKRISIIEAMLAQRRERRGGIGDNNPPEDFPTTDEDVEEIKKLIDLLKEPSPEAGALPAELAVQTSRVSELSDKFFDSLANQAGSELGKKVTDIGFWYGLYCAVKELVRVARSLL